MHTERVRVERLGVEMKKVTATLASLALAAGLTVPTASVANDGEDIAKVIAGIAALAIIAKAVDDKNDRKEAAATQQSRPVYSQVNRSGSSGFQPVNRDRNQPRYIDEPTFGELIDDRSRDKARNGVRANRLPDTCQRLVRTPRGGRLVYGARCLNRNWG